MKKSFCIFILCVFIPAIIFFIFCGKPVPHQVAIKQDIISLPARQLTNQSFTYTKSFIGSVQAIQSVAVVPYLSGYLKEVSVQSGAEVQEGQTLFKLDDRIPRANLNQAKEAKSQAQAARENAQIYYNRMRQTDTRAVSSTDLEQAKTEFEAADAAYQKALAAENQAQTIYDYTNIQAPISGWVGNITPTVGEYLSPEGKTLATIIRFSPIRLTFAVPMASYNGKFDTTDAVLRVILADNHVLEFKDFKVLRDNQADKSTDSFPFFTDVENLEKSLIPGAYVEIQFIYPKIGILVDKNWITLTPDGAEATLLKNGIVEKVPVQIGAPINNQYWIKSGLLPGDKIITVPVSSLYVGHPAQGVFK